jgi:crotonobetainyl-CoA:carnitine CoA-transferase CaiB-like acyl-CoA transferase
MGDAKGSAIPQGILQEKRPGPRLGPLAGVRVIDLTRAFGGPLATMILAEMGAEVIKIEEPKVGDESRTFHRCCPAA